MLVEIGAHFSADGEPRWHGKSYGRHFCQIRSLASQQLSHLRVSVSVGAEFKNEFALFYLSILPVCDRCHSVFLTFKLKECASVSPV